jgi:hypothetical protein
MGHDGDDDDDDDDDDDGDDDYVTSVSVVTFKYSNNSPLMSILNQVRAFHLLGDILIVCTYIRQIIIRSDIIVMKNCSKISTSSVLKFVPT